MSSLSISVATNLDDRLACDAIRSARFLTFGAEYAEEFDGSDWSAAAHLLARNQGRPIGTVRIRFLYAGIVAFERLAILKGAPARTLPRLIDSALTYSRAKGCSTILGSVNDPRLQSFWQRRGAVLKPQAKSITQDGRAWTLMRIDLAGDLAGPPPDPHLLATPEGALLISGEADRC